jgi:hypothetical protein
MKIRKGGDSDPSPCGIVVCELSCGIDVSGKWSGVSGGDVHGQIRVFQAQRIPVPYTPPIDTWFRAAMEWVIRKGKGGYL